MDRQTVETYSRRFAEYLSIDPAPGEVAALSNFLSRLPAHARILDLGCGPGIQGAIMAAQGHLVDAIDPTPEFVEAARMMGLNAREGTFDDIPEGGAYDAVWASFSLLHAPRSDMPRHLTAIRAALRPGGLIYLGMKLGTGEDRDPLGRFYSYYSEKELRDLLAQAGYTDIEATLGEGKGLAGTVDPFVLMTAHA